MNDHCIRCGGSFTRKAWGMPRYYGLVVEHVTRGDFTVRAPFFCSRLCVLAAQGERDG